MEVHTIHLRNKQNVTDLHYYTLLPNRGNVEKRAKQRFTSRSLSPTFTPALAAGPSADTLEMKIPWTKKQHKIARVVGHF